MQGQGCADSHALGGVMAYTETTTAMPAVAISEPRRRDGWILPVVLTLVVILAVAGAAAGAFLWGQSTRASDGAVNARVGAAKAGQAHTDKVFFNGKMHAALTKQRKSLEKRMNKQVEKASQQGYANGQAQGYASGHATGQTEGEKAGHAAGRRQGRREGYSSGAVDGYSEGFDEGACYDPTTYDYVC